MDVLKINGLRVRSEVGFSPHEIGKPQELTITMHLRTSIKKAGESDCVEDTMNYRTITKDVLFHVENKKYNLIEAVATDVARICVVRHGVRSVKVTVYKLNSLRFSDSSSVTIERCLEDFEWNDVHISIGSNIEPQMNLPLALSMLREQMGIVKLSGAFRLQNDSRWFHRSGGFYQYGSHCEDQTRPSRVSIAIKKWSSPRE